MAIPVAHVLDPFGRDEDADALLEAARCGVGLLASAHADGMEDMLRRPMLRRLRQKRHSSNPHTRSAAASTQAAACKALRTATFTASGVL